MILKLRVYEQACAWLGWPCRKHLYQAFFQFYTLLFQFQGHSWSFGMIHRFSSSLKRSLKILVTAFEIVYPLYFELMGLELSVWLSELSHKMLFHWCRKPLTWFLILLLQWSLALRLHNRRHWVPLPTAFYTQLRHLCTRTIRPHRWYFFHFSCARFALPICFTLFGELCFEAFGLSFENAAKNLSSICPPLVFYSITLSNLKDDATPNSQCVVHCCFNGIVESGPKNVNVDFSFMEYLMECCSRLH